MLVVSSWASNVYPLSDITAPILYSPSSSSFQHLFAHVRGTLFYQYPLAAFLSPAGAVAEAFTLGGAAQARSGSRGGGGGREDLNQTDGGSHGGGGAGVVHAGPWDCPYYAGNAHPYAYTGNAYRNPYTGLLSSNGNLDQAAALFFDDNGIQVQ